MIFNKFWHTCFLIRYESYVRPNGQGFFHFIDKYYANQLSNSHMTWDFQEDTHVQDGKWQVNFF